MNFLSRSESAILLLGDLAVFGISLWVTLCVRYLSFPAYDLFMSHFVPFSILTAIWVLVFFIAGLYDRQTELVRRHLFDTIIYAQIINIALAAVFFFFVPYFGITPKTNLVIYLFVSSGFLFLWRLILSDLCAPRQTQKALLMGEGHEMDELVREVNTNPRYDFTFVRMLDAEVISHAQDLEARVRSLVERERIAVIVADTRNKHLVALAPLFFDLTFSKARVRFIEFYTMYEEIFGRVPLSLLRYEWFLAYATRSPHPLYDAAKRALDIGGALLCTVVYAALVPFVWCAIFLEDRGPLFVRQRRLGIYGTTIDVLKFRTMTSSENGVWLGESANRVTRVGAFLRKTSLDELPQVLNILRGEMSLIGPRNDIEGLAARLSREIPFYTIRTIIKPGITGWAQTHQYYTPGTISPQSVEDTRMRLSYDLFYIKHRSLLLDVIIALRTIKTLLSRFGITIPLLRRYSPRAGRVI